MEILNLRGVLFLILFFNSGLVQAQIDSRAFPVFLFPENNLNISTNKNFKTTQIHFISGESCFKSYLWL